MFNCKMLQFTVYICYLSIYLIVPFTIIDYNKKILIFCINTFAFIKVIYNFNFLIPDTILNNLSRHTGCYFAGWYIVCYYSACGYDYAVTDCYAAKDCCARTYPYAFADMYRLWNCICSVCRILFVI